MVLYCYILIQPFLTRMMCNKSIIRGMTGTHSNFGSPPFLLFYFCGLTDDLAVPVRSFIYRRVTKPIYLCIVMVGEGEQPQYSLVGFE